LDDVRLVVEHDGALVRCDVDIVGVGVESQVEKEDGGLAGIGLSVDVVDHLLAPKPKP
jgi:hypothetical protein